jgi:CBS domain-containing protein
MKVRGIVTERDLVRRLLGEKRDPDTTILSDTMTTNPRTAHEDDILGYTLVVIAMSSIWQDFTLRVHAWL